MMSPRISGVYSPHPSLVGGHQQYSPRGCFPDEGGGGFFRSSSGGGGPKFPGSFSGLKESMPAQYRKSISLGAGGGGGGHHRANPLTFIRGGVGGKKGGGDKREEERLLGGGGEKKVGGGGDGGERDGKVEKGSRWGSLSLLPGKSREGAAGNRKTTGEEGEEGGAVAVKAEGGEGGQPRGGGAAGLEERIQKQM